MGVSVIIAYNDLNVNEPLITLGIFYKQIKAYFSNLFTNVIKSIINRLNKLINVPSSEEILPPQKVDKVLRRSEYTLHSQPDKTPPFYKSAYFYLPVIIIISGVTFYYNYDSITTFLVSSGIYNNFNRLTDYIFGSNNHFPTPPSSPTLPSDPSSSNIELKDIRNDSAPLVIPKDNVWSDQKSSYEHYFRETNSPTDSIGSNSSSGSNSTIGKGKGKA